MQMSINEINVIVSISSVFIYTQSPELPLPYNMKTTITTNLNDYAREITELKCMFK
jgi:hypothetical protein